MEIKTKTKQERLSYIFSVIMNAKKKNKLASNDPVYLEFNEIIVKPYFFLFTFEEDFIELLSDIKKDKDFFRKHNMIGYNPGFEIDPLHEEDGIIKFSDFTDDFIKEYTEDRLNIEQSVNNDSSDKTIKKIEVMVRNNEWEGIKMFINGNYNNPINFKNGEYVKLFYTLAQDQRISSSRGLVSYFNSNKANPLYKRTDFGLSKILTKNGNSIEPNIPILLRTQKFISHARNKVS
jgi:hypothetical protein